MQRKLSCHGPVSLSNCCETQTLARFSNSRYDYGMEETVQDVTSEIRRYLRTGASDLFYEAWPGQNFFERAERGRQDLRGALTAEVFRRTQGASQASVPTDTVALTRRKVEPMVRGLFPRVEQDVVLALLEKSVIFLTPTSIESLLLDHPIDRPAWDLANLYLGSCGAELMAEDGPRLVGMSEGTTCYVSLEYFIEDDPFADFIVHESHSETLRGKEEQSRTPPLVGGALESWDRSSDPRNFGTQLPNGDQRLNLLFRHLPSSLDEPGKQSGFGCADQ